jgi:hypothetical protein
MSRSAVATDASRLYCWLAAVTLPPCPEVLRAIDKSPDQHRISFGTPDEVRAELKRMIQILGQDGGDMLSSVHAIIPDVPAENILAKEEFGSCK